MFDGGETLGVRRKARPPHRVMRPRRRSPYWHDPERLQGLAGIAGGQGWTPLGVAGTHGVGALVALLPAQGRRHKKITDRARQAVMLLRSSLPHRPLALGGDN